MTTAPTQPMPVAQPQNWASGAQGPNSNSSIRSVYVPPAGAPPAKPLESAAVIAVVGPEAVLASELSPRYEAYLADKMAGAPPEQLAGERQELIKQMKNLIDVKLLVTEATATIPPDGLKDFQSKVNEQFDKEQVKQMMERVKVNTTAELDAVLHQYGTSLDRKRQQAFEQTLAHEWLTEHAKPEKEIDFDTALVYYHDHKADFSFPSQARWEQLTASFANFTDKAAAYQAIAAMGNDVLKGAKFAEVAKKLSQGPTAADGGYRGWTTKGALVSKVLDDALFSPLLPVGQMSTIIEDTDGFHIIRVIERKLAGTVPFRDAQGDIKKKLLDDLAKKNIAEYLDKLRNKTTIWTIFDDAGQAPAGQLAPGQVPPGRAAIPQVRAPGQALPPAYGPNAAALPPPQSAYGR
jgi:parvulin-like peptidyl-prolyl isomerase